MFFLDINIEQNTKHEKRCYRSSSGQRSPSGKRRGWGWKFPIFLMKYIWSKKYQTIEFIQFGKYANTYFITCIYFFCEFGILCNKNHKLRKSKKNWNMPGTDEPRGGDPAITVAFCSCPGSQMRLPADISEPSSLDFPCNSFYKLFIFSHNLLDLAGSGFHCI